jgi:hypothetical protein
MTPESFYQWLAGVERKSRTERANESARRAEHNAPYRGPDAQDVDAFIDSLHKEWGRK